MTNLRDYTKLSQHACVSHMKQVQTAIREVETGSNSRWGGAVQSNILKELHKFTNLLTKLDYAALTPQQQQQVGRLVFESMTQVKEYITLKAHTQLWDKFARKPQKKIYRLQTALQTVVNMQEKTMLSTADSNPMIVGWTPEGEAAPVNFPVYSFDNAVINRAYERLHETWEQTSLKILSTEDTYLLVALATNYLPESVTLLRQLSKHSVTAKEQCENMFLEQLSLMQQQVDALLAKESDTILSAMQAHTRFLAQKVPVTNR